MVLTKTNTRWKIQSAKFLNKIFFHWSKEKKRNRKTDIQTDLTLNKKKEKKKT